MIVKYIKLNNYRNFNEIDIELNDKLNIFIGNNAQGKTNLLESIYISSIGRTFRTNKEEDLIKFGSKKSIVDLTITKKNRIKKIRIELEKSKKKVVKINDIRLEKNNDLIGILNNVIFTPDDLKLIKGSPSERRKLLNIIISQIKPNYKYLLKNYKKVIIQRNNILRNINNKNFNREVLEIWNNYLVNIGTDILEYRKEYFKSLKKYSKEIYSNISQNNEILDIEYKSSLGIVEKLNREQTKEIFNKKIKKNLDKEIYKGITLFGPHRDDLIIKINKKECKSFGSQGQQRSAALSLKLSEIEIIKNEIGEYPILLLDDVLSELDNNRKKYLLSYINKLQTIITSTNDIDLNNIIKEKNKKIFHVKNGQIDNNKE